MYRKIQNLDKIPKEERGNLTYLVGQMETVLERGGVGSFIISFFYDCIDGQIIRSLMPRKSKGRYYNKLSDFYVDSRVGFQGRRDMDDVMKQLTAFFMKISKFRPRRFNLGDVVRVKKSPNHGWLSNKPELWGTPAIIKKLHPRSLGNMDYEGFDIQISGKGGWIDVGSDSVTKVNRGSGRTLKLLAGYFKAKPIGNDLYKLEVKYRSGFKKKEGTYRLGTIENGVYTFIPNIR